MLSNAEKIPILDPEPPPHLTVLPSSASALETASSSEQDPVAPPKSLQGKKRAEKPTKSNREQDSSGQNPTCEEIGYRFPYSRVMIEPVPDTSGAYGTAGTFALRTAWHRGKAVLPLFESTALRPIALVTLGGQHFPVFLSQHSRKRRERIILGGRRKTAKSPRCALRFVAVVEGREDKISWLWRIAATSAAMEYAPKSKEGDAPDEITLALPFAPGKAVVLQQSGVSSVLALWMNDMVATVAVESLEGFKADENAQYRFHFDERSFYLTMQGVDLSGKGASLRWETWFAPARTEAEARAALLRHAADMADRVQIPPTAEQHQRLRGGLLQTIEASQRVLLADNWVDKRGMDKHVFRATPDQPALHAVGRGTDAALAVVALLARFYMTGDDALRRRARLISNGITDFQVNEEESSHWGAIWDAVHNKKVYANGEGEGVLSVATTARTAKGLFVSYTHFEKELIQRTALSATQWLLLKTDRDGFIPAEFFTEEGPPIDADASPWIMAEAMIPFVETFRTNENEVFLRAAQRIMRLIQERVADSKLPFETASCELLAAAVEGILMISREYESEDMIATAREIMLGLRVRRQPDGSLIDPPGVTTTSPIATTLAGARAALAMARVDDDPQWFLFALRAVRAAMRLATPTSDSCVSIADHTQLILQSLGVLLAVAQRINGAEADRDKIIIKKGWQTFAPDPATREYIGVQGADGEPVDYLALVCPVSLQVLIAVITPPTVTSVQITKNGKTPFVKNLLSGELDIIANVAPLGEGNDANIGVFLADT